MSDRGLEPIGDVMDRMAVGDATWERVVAGVADHAAPRGGSDERGERLRRAAHELCGPFVEADVWQASHDLAVLPAPVARVSLAIGQTLVGLIYSGSPRDRQRRARLLTALLRESEAVAAERRTT